MLSNITAKIASARRLLFASIVVLCLLLAIIVFGIPLLYSRREPQVILGKNKFKAEVASTDVSRQQGLSGRNNLPSDSSMVFVFDSPGIQCFWMKDMKFSIDMLWISADSKIAHIEHNVPPGSYPRSYCPQVPALWVVELAAGASDTMGLRIGDTFTLDL